MTSVTNREQQAFDNIPEAESDAPAIVNSDPLWDMERRWRKLSNKYDDIPASCFRQCADELRAELLRQGDETMTTTTQTTSRVVRMSDDRPRITDHDLAGVRCAVNHSGNTTLCATSDRRYAECQGCGTWYSAAQIFAAMPGSGQ